MRYLLRFLRALLLRFGAVPLYHGRRDSSFSGKYYESMPEVQDWPTARELSRRSDEADGRPTDEALVDESLGRR